MSPSRRLALKSLAAASLMGSMPTLATPNGGGRVNVVGFGSCGGRIVRRLAAERRSVVAEDFVAADDLRPGRDVPTIEVLRGVSEPNEGRPLVVVTGASSRSRGEHAWRRANEWSEARGATVVPIVVLGFAFEGSYRDHGIALAGRFAERFGAVSLIDNQAIDDQFMPDDYEMSLLDLYERINAYALASISQVLRAARNA